MTATHPNAGIAAWRVKLAAVIGSYDDCRTFIEGAGDEDNEDIRRELGAHMYVIYRDGCADEGCPVDFECYEVYLYDTPIIRYYPDGTFSVDNGGFNTLTTMYRLNVVLPDGWAAFHERKQLGLRRFDYGGEPYVRAERFWPCTHERRFKNG
jgi:hypothetical protein